LDFFLVFFFFKIPILEALPSSDSALEFGLASKYSESFPVFQIAAKSSTWPKSD